MATDDISGIPMPAHRFVALRRVLRIDRVRGGVVAGGELGIAPTDGSPAVLLILNGGWVEAGKEPQCSGSTEEIAVVVPAQVIAQAVKDLIG